ncbi:hypothetical protein WJX81_001440 [Elliptochloris bilobata]|uniref:Uncharacterized protein n=1 Tax=Elliptochloris bilobata TaxID=381761 RepID=A0AAW1S532_9CHLO
MFNRKGSDEGKAKHAGENGHSKDCKHVLPLFTQYKNLPPDGKVLTEEEELCNPKERTCAAPMYVWERKCHACSGTGYVRASSRSRRGRSACGVCPTCIGLGYVRCTSSRIVPELNNGSGPHFSIMRPKDDEDEYESD